jgi:hypothetical protein
MLNLRFCINEPSLRHRCRVDSVSLSPVSLEAYGDVDKKPSPLQKVRSILRLHILPHMARRHIAKRLGIMRGDTVLGQIREFATRPDVLSGAAVGACAILGNEPIK